jgi:hypothetical protein
MGEQSACKDVVLEFFNTVLGHTDKSHSFWRVSIKKTLRSKFPFILTEAESDENYNMLDAGCIKLVRTSSGVKTMSPPLPSSASLPS